MGKIIEDESYVDSLEHQISMLDEENADLEKEIIKLKKENEKLKKELLDTNVKLNQLYKHY